MVTRRFAEKHIRRKTVRRKTSSPKRRFAEKTIRRKEEKSFHRRRVTATQHPDQGNSLRTWFANGVRVRVEVRVRVGARVRVKQRGVVVLFSCTVVL